MSQKLPNIADSCVLLVQSCDAYEDVWEMFFSALLEYWKDCKVDIILNTETKTVVFNGLNINKNNYCKYKQYSSWGERLLDVLGRIEKKYVITLFDDFILEGKVNENKIVECLRYMEENKTIGAFYFNNIPGNTKESYEDFIQLDKTADYKVNSCPAIWRKSVLQSVTGSMDSPWAWEFFGSVRAYGNEYEYYCAKLGAEDTFIYQYQLGGAIRRGKWVKAVVSPAIKKYNLSLDPTIRGYASNSLSEGKYSFKWKVDFVLLGVRMVGVKAFIPLFRAILLKIERLWKKK